MKVWQERRGTQEQCVRRAGGMFSISLINAFGVAEASIALKKVLFSSVPLPPLGSPVVEQPSGPHVEHRQVGSTPPRWFHSFLLLCHLKIFSLKLILDYYYYNNNNINNTFYL